MQALNPNLIYCSVTGYGQTGPLRNYPAIEWAVQAMSGMSASYVADDVDGAYLGIGVLDPFSGYVAFSAILAALLQRAQTGRGQRIDVSMLDAAMLLMAPRIVSHQLGQRGQDGLGRRPTMVRYRAKRSAPVRRRATSQVVREAVRDHRRARARRRPSLRVTALASGARRRADFGHRSQAGDALGQRMGSGVRPGRAAGERGAHAPGESSRIHTLPRAARSNRWTSQSSAAASTWSAPASGSSTISRRSRAQSQAWANTPLKSWPSWVSPSELAAPATASANGPRAATTCWTSVGHRRRWHLWIERFQNEADVLVGDVIRAQPSARTIPATTDRPMPRIPAVIPARPRAQIRRSQCLVSPDRGTCARTRRVSKGGA